MDVVSAKVLGTGAIVFGVVFIVTSVLRLTRPDLDLVLAILNITFGVLLLCVGVVGDGHKPSAMAPHPRVVPVEQAAERLPVPGQRHRPLGGVS
jgi:hypothetical protein